MESSTRKNKSITYVRIAILTLIVGIAIFGYMQYGKYLSLENLANQEARLREIQQDNPILVYGIAFLIYVAVTGLSLPGATVLTLVYGWYFKFLRGLVLVSFASTTGATLAFLLSRYLLRDFVQNRFGERLKTFNENLEKEGAFYLFSLRLIPAVPFFVINVVMGLTPMKTRTFWWVSQVGMLAGTMIYVYAGSVVPSLQRLAEEGINAVFTPGQIVQITFAFVLLGLTPLIIRQLLKLFRKKPIEEKV